MSTFLKRRIVIMGVIILLTAVACVCTSLSNLTGGGGSTRGTVPGYTGPVYDGGDGLDTILVQQIGLGQSQTARLDSIFEGQNWLYDGTAGQTITVTVQGIGGTDPRVQVIDPSGSVLAEDDDSGGGAGGLDALVTVTLPTTGTYTMRIDVFSTGEYSISIQ